jgi:hypothetical protein
MTFTVWLSTEDRYWREQENRKRFLFIEKEKFCFFSFPKKEFLLIRIDCQCSQSSEVLDLAKGCEAFMGV